MENRVLGLLKVGNKAFMETLFHKGEVFMNTLDYFRKLEKENPRRDKSEGSFSLNQIPWLQMKLDSGLRFEFSLKEGAPVRLKEPVKLRTYDPNLRGNVFCMHSFTANMCNNSIKVDSRIYEFGDAFVLILNSEAFADRVCEGLKELNEKYEYNLVQYYDDSLEYSNLNCFTKPERFQHENEFRFFIPNNDNTHLKINIGSIQDIAILKPIEDLEKMVFQVQENGLIVFGFPQD